MRDVSRELRNRRGEWTSGGADAERAMRALAVAGRGNRAKVQTPTEFRHPDTGHSMGKSEIGDTFEHILASKGAHLLEKRYGGTFQLEAGVTGAGKSGGRSTRGTALDFRLGKYGGEIKTINRNAKNQKTALKYPEMVRKEAEVRANGLAPLLVVQRVDMANQRIDLFAMPQFASRAVSKMEPLGSYEFTREDFKNAQQDTGHWAQRFERARRQRAVTGTAGR